jgi:hypothetical protein
MADDTTADKPTSRKDAPSQRAVDMADMIDKWFADHFYGSAVARYTEAYNVAQAAKEDLKARFAAAFK